MTGLRGFLITSSRHSRGKPCDGTVASGWRQSVF
jgi:hypothetical protein